MSSSISSVTSIVGSGFLTLLNFEDSTSEIRAGKKLGSFEISFAKIFPSLLIPATAETAEKVTLETATWAASVPGAA